MVHTQKVRKSIEKKITPLAKIQNKTPFDFGVFDKQKKYLVGGLLLIMGLGIAYTYSTMDIEIETFVFKEQYIGSGSLSQVDYSSWFDGVSTEYHQATKHELLKALKERGISISKTQPAIETTPIEPTPIEIEPTNSTATIGECRGRGCV